MLPDEMDSGLDTADSPMRSRKRPIHAPPGRCVDVCLDTQLRTALTYVRWDDGYTPSAVVDREAGQLVGPS
jgi:hypothetical protein